MPAFHMENFGCRAARADGEAVSSRLRAAGLGEREPAKADVVLVNTCSVTAEAERAARAFIRRAHRVNPNARIVVTGCYAQRAPQELAAIDGVAAVVGNSHKAFAPGIALSLTGHSAPHTPPAAPRAGSEFVQIQAADAASAPPQVVWADDRFAHSFLEELLLVPGAQTRPNLKIQEGCGNRCAFCVIPQTRGSSRSLSAAAVLKQVEGFVAAGGNELVLSGINLGRWGRDLADPSRDKGLPQGPTGSRPTLSWLVERIFNQTSLPRLRLSSIEPMDWDGAMIGLMREFGGTRLARHAHLPLQSGSDAVLRRMHRRYRPWHYEEKVWALVDAVGPDLTLGADVMVGFPSETDAEFEETLALVRKLPFSYLHLFPFSPRPGTPAWALHAEHPVGAKVVKERMAQLRALSAEKTKAHRSRFVGRELDTITLQTPPELASAGRTAALTENFLPLELEGRLAANRLVRVRVSGLNEEEALLAAACASDPAQDAHEPAQYNATAMSV
jgi:threonylcarbamoyladenosine tRNA methylthiotransferase MtaB